MPLLQYIKLQLQRSELQTYKNNEGYQDNTAGKAIQKADRPPKPVLDVIRMIKDLAWFCGFEIVGHIRLKDRHTGKEYR